MYNTITSWTFCLFFMYWLSINSGGRFFKGRVWFYCIIPDEKLHHSFIKFFYACKVVSIPFNKIFMEGSIESFYISIFLWSFRIYIKMRNFFTFKKIIKSSCKFTFIIRLHTFYFTRKNKKKLFHKFFCTFT